MSAAPRVTVGLPVFNGERYLAETIESILAQDLIDLELVVADNASTDRTVALVEGFAARDPRVRLLRSDRNLGAARNYNRLVHEGTGGLFKWAGYDDILEPTYLSRCVEALEAAPDAVLAYPGTVIIDADGAVVRPYPERLDLRQAAPWRRVAALAWRVSLCNACFGVARREAMLRSGLIRPYPSSDVTYLAEMAAQGAFVHVPQPLFRRRIHEGTSRQGRSTPAAVARWFDTSATRAPRAPRLRLVGGVVGALLGAPVPPTARARCAAAFAGVYAARRLRIRAHHTYKALAHGRVQPARLIDQLPREPV